MTSGDITIHPIRNEHDYFSALHRIGELLRVEPDTPGGDEFEALASLIDAYEEKHFPIAMPNPIAAIEFRLEQQGLTRKDLEPMIGSRARVSEVMTGKRKLTLAMIRRLRDGLGIPADVLIGPAVEAPPAPSSAIDRSNSRNPRMAGAARRRSVA